jgi:hypothetical protein
MLFTISEPLSSASALTTFNKKKINWFIPVPKPSLVLFVYYR